MSNKVSLIVPKSQLHGGGGQCPPIFTYSSEPKAILLQQVQNHWRYKFREPVREEGHYKYGNIMYDPRVFRGNSYSQRATVSLSQVDLEVEEKKRKQELRRKLLERKMKRQEAIKTPPGIPGREHKPIQTELYLEELTDRVQESDVSCQTDPFLDRPATPKFVPAKIGIDVATQIFEDDLWDFDLEVRPILEVLVGKTIEQGLLEVLQEEELAMLRRQQKLFEELRDAERAEAQRLEDQERRHREEKESRLKQMEEAKWIKQETEERVAAGAFAKSYLTDLVPSVFSNLEEAGYFYDPVERELEQGFFPWLSDSTLRELNKEFIARRTLDAIIKNVIREKMNEYSAIKIPDETVNSTLNDQRSKNLGDSPERKPVFQINDYENPHIPPWELSGSYYYPPGTPTIPSPDNLTPEYLRKQLQKMEENEIEEIQKIKEKLVSVPKKTLDKLEEEPDMEELPDEKGRPEAD